MTGVQTRLASEDTLPCTPPILSQRQAVGPTLGTGEVHNGHGLDPRGACGPRSCPQVSRPRGRNRRRPWASDSGFYRTSASQTAGGGENGEPCPPVPHARQRLPSWREKHRNRPEAAPSRWHPRVPRTRTHVLHVVHGLFWQLEQEVPDAVAARGLSQTHGPLVQRQAVTRPHLRVCQPFRDAPSSLAGDRPRQGPGRPWGPPASVGRPPRSRLSRLPDRNAERLPG